MNDLLSLLAKNAEVTLFDYQREFLEDVGSLPHPLRACLYYKTGAGKSLTSMAAIALLGYDRCVVVCPPSTHSQWTDLGWKLGVTVEPMSHARFRFKETKLKRDVPVIADEFHLFGGQQGKGWRKLDKLAAHLKAPLILCSATPNYNDAERCYCVQHILSPDTVKGGYLQFLYTECITEQNPFGMVPIVQGFKHHTNAAEYLSSLDRVYYLPDDLAYKIEEVEYMASLPSALYDYGYNERDHRMVASQIEMRHTERLQGLIATNGELHAHVRDELIALLGEHTLVYATHATVAEAVSRSLARKRIHHEIITGKTSKVMKDELLREVRFGDVPVLIGTATLATGTDGLDRVCDTMIILDDTDDEALRRQLVGRIMPRGDFVSPEAKKIFRMKPVS